MSIRFACLASLDPYTYVEKMLISLRMEKKQHQWWIYMGKEAAVPLSARPKSIFGTQKQQMPRNTNIQKLQEFPGHQPHRRIFRAWVFIIVTRSVQSHSLNRFAASQFLGSRSCVEYLYWNLWMECPASLAYSFLQWVRASRELVLVVLWVERFWVPALLSQLCLLLLFVWAARRTRWSLFLDLEFATSSPFWECLSRTWV